MSVIEFAPYPKTPRLRRELVITEKIDGTNAQVHIRKVGEFGSMTEAADDYDIVIDAGDDILAIRAGSRTRWIKPGKDNDNYGFAGWVQRNADDLLKLGVGQHFGEWWGSGINRGYGVLERRFSLFNVHRWGSHNPNTPACCGVVPVLGTVGLDGIGDLVDTLREEGSVAAPGFMSPEGIIVYHTASKQTYKVLLENDELPKGAVA